ncbi:MAG: 16S rRNA (cytosine(1402)-N(4))-methyltransferase [Candidatus Taylorbacteria bacterium RIFCSPLOWO2_12_FULL_43_20]|uniref:Ribosomal RNA small subunit methyltransferase H n=1 Tax=Candidatus Taylorbacteria bacterium RIFCSPLOWO2_12_FULL_43_20 TaxID=1802332 RepID=A0A1G2P1P6_9BACT|nr:MAG: 16S rRNA (cytosine(1402)-N(4))-methyltransferase [Candidatus Taylorbacteria bacterium RIFCSPHIGHO2_01_FULL_43_120]OHA22616.1 MAG: 16S rRNA (cytosine(1402)-N(4))-methyltransferase [Candidatus Taylorbacteria bacterium RIFCSPHIGHO2_02_FULL_43_55]OHA28945.1 MAG: 16S rRNA (cytosine(1402)-N(4))-methyltransferase [Candidatus Taylorbacteria bacterium RIFCSPHIGHO2_12_FULL_42_34]OHA31834.1 MAG: 16S rRNA (cytosine(1402)-N(4))-methyltransferase [Candidatus Taylorbacteria bacterium RIFCSPLOWO2_01_FUL
MNAETIHKTVLLNESIDGLRLKVGEVFLDATINGGGHSAEVARRFAGSVKIIGIDLDGDALERAGKRLEAGGADFMLKRANFRDIRTVVGEIGSAPDKILFDLGWSSDQMESGRGFSFQKDEPLRMTYSKESDGEAVTAREILNSWDEENIADIIYGFGEERYAKRIAKAIAEERQRNPINTTFEFVEIIYRAIPAAYRGGKIHFATKTFQALRMAVNDELPALKEALSGAFEVLRPEGRLAVISFHSSEDRVVKRFFKELSSDRKHVLVNKKPITPSVQEVKSNRRARSAKLRIIEKHL